MKGHNNFSDYEIPEELASDRAQLNPYPQFETLRDESPVRYDEDRDVWDVFRYEDVNAAITDHEVFSSEGTSHFGKHFLASDPPDHTKLRDMVSDYFHSSHLSDLEPIIERRAEQYLSEAVSEDGTVDWLEDVAIPLPISIIADLVGIPQSKLRLYREWSEYMLGAPVDRPNTKRKETRQEMRDFFGEIADEREKNPRDDIVSTLVQCEDAVDMFDRTLTINTCILIMVGGHITTSTFASNAMWTFIEHDVFSDVRAGDVSLEDALEEVLRYRPAVARSDRLTTERAQLNGTEIPEGEHVILWLASANRDERVFDDPDEFVPDRQSEYPHMAFGRGVHTCIGNNLARLEVKTLFSKFVEKYRSANLRVAPSDLDPFYSTMISGTEHMPIEVVE
jgi:cytochrome P450